MSLPVFYSRLLKSLLLSFMSVVELLSIKIITITFTYRACKSDYRVITLRTATLRINTWTHETFNSINNLDLLTLTQSTAHTCYHI